VPADGVDAPVVHGDGAVGDGRTTDGKQYGGAMQG